MREFEIVTSTTETAHITGVVNKPPRYEIGDRLQITAGDRAGASFDIVAIRYDSDRDIFQYLYDWIVNQLWVDEDKVAEA